MIASEAGPLTIQLPGRIPFLTVDAYATRRAIEGESFDLLQIGIQAMDDEYQAVTAEQREQG